MRSLFELVTDEHLKHYIDIWERSVFPKQFSFSTPKSIDELKNHLRSCNNYSELISEAVDIDCKGLQSNTNLINEIFNYLDKKTLN